MSSRYIAFYKPYLVLSQFSKDDRGTRTLADYIDVPGVYPAGRLDSDSEGLLLLTNDGRLQHRLTDPKFGHPRTYWAQVEGSPPAEALARLQSGVAVQDYITRPAKVRVLSPTPDLPAREPPIRYRREIPTTWIELILTEGRNRQVRRMTAAVGFPTLRLVRVAIGDVTLSGLQPGQWRDLEPAEIRGLIRFGAA